MLSWIVRWYYDLLRRSVHFFKFYIFSTTFSIYRMNCIITIISKLVSWLCLSFSTFSCNPQSILFLFFMSRFTIIVRYVVLFCHVLFSYLSFYNYYFFFVLGSIFFMVLLFFVLFEVSLLILLSLLSRLCKLLIASERRLNNR